MQNYEVKIIVGDVEEVLTVRARDEQDAIRTVKKVHIEEQVSQYEQALAKAQVVIDFLWSKMIEK